MPVCGNAYHRRLLQSSYKVRATISRKLCSSISSILYLFITISLQFGVVHGQALLYVGHHHVLRGKGNHLQSVVLLHLHLTPVWRCTWSGSALCGPPPSPPHGPELSGIIWEFFQNMGGGGSSQFPKPFFILKIALQSP